MLDVKFDKMLWSSSYWQKACVCFTVNLVPLPFVPVLILNTFTMNVWMLLSIRFISYPSFVAAVIVSPLLWFFATPCSVLHRHGEHLCPHCDVFLLCPCCHRPSHAEVPVVEEIPHVSAAGERLPLCIPWTVTGSAMCSWRTLIWSLPLQVQFLLVLLHTSNNLFRDCNYPDSMNAVVCVYSVTLIILFGNFYYNSYLSKKKQK